VAVAFSFPQVTSWFLGRFYQQPQQRFSFNPPPPCLPLSRGLNASRHGIRQLLIPGIFGTSRYNQLLANSLEEFFDVPNYPPVKTELHFLHLTGRVRFGQSIFTSPLLFLIFGPYLFSYYPYWFCPMVSGFSLVGVSNRPTFLALTRTRSILTPPSAGRPFHVKFVPPHTITFPCVFALQLLSSQGPRPSLGYSGLHFLPILQ